MNEKKVLKRKLRSFERYFFRRPSSNILIGLKLYGKITKAQLRTALSKVSSRHPLIGARIIQDGSENAWFTNDRVPKFPIRVINITKENLIDKEWEKIVKEEHKFYFPLDKGPLMRFILLKAGSISEIIINCHHVYCDGLSMAYFIRDLLKYLGNPELDVEQLPEPPLVNENTIPPAFSLGQMQKMMIYLVNKLWSRKNIYFSEKDHRELHQSYWGNGRKINIKYWELSEAQTNLLIERSRKRNVTVNSTLCTAFLAAQKDVLKNPVPRYLNKISIPVSFRDQLTEPVGEAFGLFYSSCKIKLDYLSDKSFWTNAQIIHNNIKRKLTYKNVFKLEQQVNLIHPSLLDSMHFSKEGLFDDMMGKLFLKVTRENRICESFGPSNIGKFDFPTDYGGIKLKTIHGPSIYSDFQEKYLGVITIGGKMYLTFTYDENNINSKSIDKIKEYAMKYLGDACGW